MPKVYGLSSFTLDSGERYCHVIDRTSGLPEYHPNLFLTTQIRNRGSSSATVEAAASNLVVLLRYFDRRGVDIEQRLRLRDHLREHELDDLRDFSQRRFGRVPASLPVNSISKLDEAVESTPIVHDGTQYSRLTTMAHYLGWLAKHLLTDASTEDADRINTMVTRIKARRPRKKGRGGDPEDKSLNKDQLDALFETIRLNSEHNPFSTLVQRRNRVMILLLYHLGIRGGELLNIRISDIDFGSNHLKIIRRPDEKLDPRTREPNAKTLERTLPLADSLAKEVHDYITQDRRQLPSSRGNDFLFVTHKKGPTVGQPLSKSSYHKVIFVVAAVSPRLYAMTGHKLRHTWNDIFSEKMDSMNEPPSESRQEQIRSYLMGWKEASGTAATYNKRFVQKKGQEAALELQKNTGTSLPRGIKND